MLLAGWWGDKFNRLYLNAVKNAAIEECGCDGGLLPERRVAPSKTRGSPTANCARAMSGR